jgi:hypothetical protein
MVATTAIVAMPFAAKSHTTKDKNPQKEEEKTLPRVSQFTLL